MCAQNVGVGITNPARGRFEVAGAVGITSAIFGGEGAGISVQRNAPSIGFNKYNAGTTTNMLAGRGFVQCGSQYNSYFYESVSVGLANRNTYINAGKNGSGVFINDKPGGYLLLGGGATKYQIKNLERELISLLEELKALSVTN